MGSAPSITSLDLASGRGSTRREFTVAFRYPTGFVRGPASGTIRSFSTTIPIHDPAYIRGPGELDPVHAFRAAYRAKLLHSAGRTSLGGVPAWRFTAKHGKHGLWQEWIVDRKRWLPLRYRYVDHNRQGKYKVTNRLVIRFLRFEVLRRG